MTDYLMDDQWDAFLGGTLEIPTLDLLVTLLTPEQQDIVKEKIEKDEDWKYDSLRTFKRLPNIFKHQINSTWIHYQIKYGKNLVSLGWLNRANKQLLLDDINDSVYRQLLSAFNSEYRYKFIEERCSRLSLGQYQVFSKLDYVDYYRELRDDCFVDFVLANQERFIAMATKRDKDNAEDVLYEHFIYQGDEPIDLDKNSLIQQISFDKSARFLWNEDYVFQNLDFLDFFQQDDKLKETLTQMFETDAFDKQSYDDWNELDFGDVVSYLIAYSEQETILNAYQTNYPLLVLHEVAQGISKAGKMVRVETLDGTETKVENLLLINDKTLGRWGKKVKVSDIKSLWFGKQKLFDRDSFDEKYGYLKETK